MKVLHVITRLDPGGSAENTLLTCQHLVAQGWDALLASGPGRTGEEARVDGVDVPVIPIHSLRRDPAPIDDLRALWQLYRMLRKQRPDVVHTHSAKAGVLGRWAGFFAGVPHIVHTPHGHVLYGYARGFKNWLYLLAERMTAPITDRLVALSEGERRESAAAGIGRLEAWTVIPSGVRLDGSPPPRDPARRRDSPPRESPPNGSPPDRPLRVGVVARLEPVKGVDVLVRAAGRLAAADGEPALPDFEIDVWGDGDSHHELEDLAGRCGAADLLRFVGTGEPVEAFLGSLDVYVQPSRNEGMGRALVSAQWAGLPVVASRVCGIPDIVLEGKTGILVGADDPEELADAIARLLRDDGLRNEFGGAARSWIMEEDETGFPRFSVEAMTRRLLDLYEDLARGSA